MHFLAPALLLGLIAAALPWIIHRIGQRRARPVRFAAMELLLRAEREVSARRRLRDVALLVARTGWRRRCRWRSRARSPRCGPICRR